jgi:hypothetical protein
MKNYKAPSGLSLNHYQTIAEREGLKIYPLGIDEPIQEGDLLHWLAGGFTDVFERIPQVDTAWATIEEGSPLIGRTRKDAFPSEQNVVIRLQ